MYGDISIEIKKEEENESYTVRDLLVTNNRVRSEEAQKSILGSLHASNIHLFFLPFPTSSGEQGPSGASVPFPRLARGGHPHRRQRHDQFNRSGAETAAAVRQPPHHGALQVRSLSMLPPRVKHNDEGLL